MYVCVRVCENNFQNPPSITMQMAFKIVAFKDAGGRKKTRCDKGASSIICR